MSRAHPLLAVQRLNLPPAEEQAALRAHLDALWAAVRRRPALWPGGR
jgi:hypothetical protein